MLQARDNVTNKSISYHQYNQIKQKELINQVNKITNIKKINNRIKTKINNNNK